MTQRIPWIAAAAVVAILLLEWLFGESAGAALLPALTFWASLCQGVIALLAATVLSNATWLPPDPEPAPADLSPAAGQPGRVHDLVGTPGAVPLVRAS